MVLFRARSSRGWMAQTPEMRRCILISMVGALLLLSGCTGRPDNIKPVSPFDINRYQGVWYEIMRLDHSFERGLTNVTATYILRGDGMVDVLNKGFDRKRCRWKEALGIASFQGKKTVASLSVTFFWPFAGGYHVFALDTEDYGHALVAGPSQNYLWILARQPGLSLETRNDLVSKARQHGFSVKDLILVDHSAELCSKKYKP